MRAHRLRKKPPAASLVVVAAQLPEAASLQSRGGVMNGDNDAAISRATMMENRLGEDVVMGSTIGDCVDMEDASSTTAQGAAA